MKLIGGGQMPVDLGLEPGAPLIPEVHRGVKTLRPRRAQDPPERPGFVAHWSTCPDPAFWTAARTKLDTAGVTASGLQRGRGVEHGPCAGCFWPGHLAYGPRCTGTLCDVCATVLDTWRATPGPRGMIPYPRWNPATGTREPSPLAPVIALRRPPPPGTIPADTYEENA